MPERLGLSLDGYFDRMRRGDVETLERIHSFIEAALDEPIHEALVVSYWLVAEGIVAFERYTRDGRGRRGEPFVVRVATSRVPPVLAAIGCG